MEDDIGEDRGKRRSSILKQPRSPLQDLNTNNQVPQNDEFDKERRSSRRVSFANQCQVQEFITEPFLCSNVLTSQRRGDDTRTIMASCDAGQVTKTKETEISMLSGEVQFLPVDSESSGEDTRLANSAAAGNFMSRLIRKTNQCERHMQGLEGLSPDLMNSTFLTSPSDLLVAQGEYKKLIDVYDCNRSRSKYDGTLYPRDGENSLELTRMTDVLTGYVRPFDSRRTIFFDNVSMDPVYQADTFALSDVVTETTHVEEVGKHEVDPLPQVHDEHSIMELTLESVASPSTQNRITDEPVRKEVEVEDSMQVEAQPADFGNVADPPLHGNSSMELTLDNTTGAVTETEQHRDAAVSVLKDCVESQTYPRPETGLDDLEKRSQEQDASEIEHPVAIEVRDLEVGGYGIGSLPTEAQSKANPLHLEGETKMDSYSPEKSVKGAEPLLFEEDRMDVIDSANEKKTVPEHCASLVVEEKIAAILNVETKKIEDEKPNQTEKCSSEGPMAIAQEQNYLDVSKVIQLNLDLDQTNTRSTHPPHCLSALPCLESMESEQLFEAEVSSVTLEPDLDRSLPPSQTARSLARRVNTIEDVTRRGIALCLKKIAYASSNQLPKAEKLLSVSEGVKELQNPVKTTEPDSSPTKNMQKDNTIQQKESPEVALNTSPNSSLKNPSKETVRREQTSVDSGLQEKQQNPEPESDLKKQSENSELSAIPSHPQNPVKESKSDVQPTKVMVGVNNKVEFAPEAKVPSQERQADRSDCPSIEAVRDHVPDETDEKIMDMSYRSPSPISLCLTRDIRVPPGAETFVIAHVPDSPSLADRRKTYTVNPALLSQDLETEDRRKTYLIENPVCVQMPTKQEAVCPQENVDSADEPPSKIPKRKLQPSERTTRKTKIPVAHTAIDKKNRKQPKLARKKPAKNLKRSEPLSSVSAVDVKKSKQEATTSSNSTSMMRSKTIPEVSDFEARMILLKKLMSAEEKPLKPQSPAVPEGMPLSSRDTMIDPESDEFVRKFRAKWKLDVEDLSSSLEKVDKMLEDVEHIGRTREKQLATANILEENIEALGVSICDMKQKFLRDEEAMKQRAHQLNELHKEVAMKPAPKNESWSAFKTEEWSSSLIHVSFWSQTIHLKLRLDNTGEKVEKNIADFDLKRLDIAGGEHPLFKFMQNWLMSGLQKLNLKMRCKMTSTFTRMCKGKTTKLQGFVWTGVSEISFVTDHGVEVYRVLPEKKLLTLLKTFAFHVNWFVFSASDGLLLLSMGSRGNHLQPVQFRPGSAPQKLPKFEVDLPLSSSQQANLLERDVLLANLYGRLYVVVLRHQSRGGGGASASNTGAQVVLYALSQSGRNGGSGNGSSGSGPPPRKQHVVRLDMGGRFAMNVIDNLLVVHNQESKASALFDVGLAGQSDGYITYHDRVSSSLLPIQPFRLKVPAPALPGLSLVPPGVGSSVGAGAGGELEIPCEAYSPNWIVFQPDVVIDAKMGCFWRLELSLEAFVRAEAIVDEGRLVDFLLLRHASSKPVLLRVLRDLVLKRPLTPAHSRASPIPSPQPQLAGIFDCLNQVYRQVLDEALGDEPSGDARKLYVDQSDMYTHVFTALAERRDAHRYLVAILSEYLRSLGQKRIQAQHFLYELVINTLVHHGRFYQLHQLLQYQVLGDSKPLACLLLSLEGVYPPAHQLALDMLKRLNTANEEITEVLLARQQLLPALRFLRCVGDADAISARKFLEAAMASADPLVFYSVYRFFEQRNVRLRGSPAFAKGDHCEPYVRHFDLVFVGQR